MNKYHGNIKINWATKNYMLSEDLLKRFPRKPNGKYFYYYNFYHIDPPKNYNKIGERNGQLTNITGIVL